MRRKLLSFAIAVASSAFMSMSAQTDVTATYLTNTGFDDSPITFLASTGLNTSAVRIGTTGWVYTIPGWTNASVVAANAVQIASAEYGSSASSSGLNGTTPPASGPSSGSTGASLHMSAGWGDKALLTQAATLPAGKYKLIYNAYNGNTVATIAANYCGFAPTSGTAVYSATKSFALSAWVSDTATFVLANETAGNISIGFTTSSAGSAKGAKLYIENVKLLYYGIDKTDLNAKISEAQTLVGSNTGSSADALNAAITAAQVVSGNTSATQADINSAIANLDTAIFNYKIANATDSDPFDVTPYFGTNLNFEANQGDKQQTIPGWTKTGADNTEFCTRSDNGPGSLGEFGYKSGNVYFQYWAQDLSDYELSQTVTGLPNGKYWIIAGASNTSASGDGFYLFAGSNQTAVSSAADYQVDANVVDGTLTFGVKAVGSIINGTGAEWTQADNFRLYYIGPVTDPTLSVSASSLAFNSTSLTKTFTVSAAYLTSDVTLMAPTGIKLDKTSLTAADANAGVTTITATFDNATNITAGSISVTSGSLSQTIAVIASADAACFVSHQPTLTNLVPDPFMLDLSKYSTSWGARSQVISDAACGATYAKVTGQRAGSLAFPITWIPGHTYHLYAKVNTDADGYVFGLGNSDVTSGVPDFESSIANTNSAWMDVDFEFTAGANAAAGNVWLNNYASNLSGTASIDNWELYDLSALSSVAANLAKPFQVFSGKGELTIQSEDAKTVSIYSITGQLVKKVNVSGSRTIALPQGFYIVNGIKSFVK